MLLLIFAGEAACRLVNSLPIFCIICSTGSIVIMSLERFRAIVQSFSVQDSNHHEHACMARWLVTVWGVALVLSIPIQSTGNFAFEIAPGQAGPFALHDSLTQYPDRKIEHH